MMKEILRVTSGKNCVGAMQISTNADDKLCITPTAAMQISTKTFNQIYNQIYNQNL